jgi:hypothetical protein
MSLLVALDFELHRKNAKIAQNTYISRNPPKTHAYAKTGLFQVPSGGLVYELVQKHRQIGYKSEPLLPVNNPPMLKPCSSSSKSINFAYQGNQRCPSMSSLHLVIHNKTHCSLKYLALKFKLCPATFIMEDRLAIKHKPHLK